MIRICLFLLICLVFSMNPAMLKADEGFIIGATAASGVIYSEQDHESVSMNREIIYFTGFQDKQLEGVRKIPLAGYKVLFEFENHSPKGVQAPCAFPVNIFFTEFTKYSRSNILDNLAGIMPDIFDFSKNDKTVLAELRKTFENRNFIRRMINVRDLSKLNMDIKIVQDGKPVTIQKIILEFRWVYDREKNQEFLAMETHLVHDLQFQPSSKSIVTVEYVVPSFNTGYNSSHYFSPYITGTGRTWKDEISEIYIVNNVLDATVVLPYYMDYEQKNYGYNQHVTIIKNHEPERNEKIGFYVTRENDCGCYNRDAYQETLYIPKPLKNVTASSWYNKKQKFPSQCIAGIDELSVIQWVPDFETGLYSKLTITQKPLHIENNTDEWIELATDSDCGDDGEPFVLFKQGYHPIWAFDMSLDSLGTQYRTHSNYGLGTSWCVFDAAGGKEQYIEFQLTQDVNELKFYTGMTKSEDLYKQYNRIARFNLKRTDGEFEKIIDLSDILTSSYEMKLKPGIYRMTVKDVFEGKEKNITCFSSLRFSFMFEDKWFTAHFNQIDS